MNDPTSHGGRVSLADWPLLPEGTQTCPESRQQAAGVAPRRRQSQGVRITSVMVSVPRIEFRPRLPWIPVSAGAADKFTNITCPYFHREHRDAVAQTRATWGPRGPALLLGASVPGRGPAFRAWAASSLTVSEAWGGVHGRGNCSIMRFFRESGRRGAPRNFCGQDLTTAGGGERQPNAGWLYKKWPRTSGQDGR